MYIYRGKDFGQPVEYYTKTSSESRPTVGSFTRKKEMISKEEELKNFLNFFYFLVPPAFSCCHPPLIFAFFPPFY